MLNLKTDVTTSYEYGVLRAPLLRFMFLRMSTALTRLQMGLNVSCLQTTFVKFYKIVIVSTYIYMGTNPSRSLSYIVGMSSLYDYTLNYRVFAVSI